ncbi:Nif3-like dinuclear metal center hexameric protein [Halarsenatibacter silvermanii]|uniref:GTP cyclohydrolase 1 type 2 homolog n=1 Tax=Halarsenatibacter silvermanii TaxID=321763 RepID=A0A1G9JT64_9FIRM|nr:Nif3-like dinuclear metal center hexameric protein [Halarsenatibacter silvermanii]SDL40727.1 dinuclear metal center protein, YbgI/SA1388 family [Halarsenatibacter silvermanii]
MVYSVSDVLKMLNEIAPFNLAEEWDNSGLQVGARDQNVEKILLTLDVDEKIIEEALNRDCEMIISHHPLIFSQLDSVTEASGTEKIVRSLIQNEITLISAHTNFDKCEGGMNDYLADKIGLKNIKPLNDDEDMNKLVVFVPVDSLQAVKNSLHEAGAGEFEKYDMAGFYSEGTGTFRPLEASSPAVGEKGDYTEVSEYRLEMIYPARFTDKIISCLEREHPYEEPAYDIFRLEQHSGEILPARTGELPQKMGLNEFLTGVKEELDAENLKYFGHDDRDIKHVAVVCGSGSDFIGAAAKSGADALLTGDIKYHDWQLARDKDLILINAGHYDTEKHFAGLMAERIMAALDSDGFHPELILSDRQENLSETFA